MLVEVAGHSGKTGQLGTHHFMRTLFGEIRPHGWYEINLNLHI